MTRERTTGADDASLSALTLTDTRRPGPAEHQSRYSDAVVQRLTGDRTYTAEVSFDTTTQVTVDDGRRTSEGLRRG